MRLGCAGRVSRRSGSLKALSALSQARGGGAGRVRNSVGVSFGRQYLLPLLPMITAANPELQLDVGLDNRPVDMVDGLAR